MDHGRPVTLKRELSYIDSSLLDTYGDEHQRKRTRTFTRSCTSAFQLQPPLATNLSFDRHERRRVNPEALALRLGPELVKALDALIVPGMVEMPSFAARREIQQRFKVDRRHIYDYYHAKGLRVLKESDKVNATPIREAAMLSYDTSSAHDFCSTRGLPARRAPLQRNASYNVSPPRTTRRTSRPRISATQYNQHSLQHPNADQATAPNTSNTLELLGYPDEPLSPVQPEAYELPRKSSPNTVNRSVQSYFEDEASNQHVRSNLNLNFDYNETEYFDNAHNSVSTVLGTNDFDSDTASNQTLPTPPPLDLAEFLEPEYASGSPVPSMLPLDGQEMTQKEREECYLFFSHALGPSAGVQESVGSYKSFMTVQKENYFENIKAPIPAPPNTPTPVQPEPVCIPAAVCDLFGEKPPPTPEEQAEDFKKWLMPSRRREAVALGLQPPSKDKAVTEEHSNILQKMWNPPVFGVETGLPPAPSVEEIFAEYRPPPKSFPPPNMTKPEDFQTFPDADFHIHGVPIVKNKPAVQPMSILQQMQAPSPNMYYTGHVVPPPYASVSQPWSMAVPPTILDVSTQYALPPYAMIDDLTTAIQPDLHQTFSGATGITSFAPPVQEPMFSTEGSVYHHQPPLYAPAPSRPRLGWLGMDQGCSLTGRLRGFSASGDF